MPEDGAPVSRTSRLCRTLAVALALATFAVLAWLFARRVPYPYDLEWMEGGTLCHALRVLARRPIYAAPSVDFIPFLYTPLHPTLLAGLSLVTPGGIGYVLARVVSAGAFIGSTALGWRFIARTGGSRAAATAAMAIPAGAFALTGAWYDLARADSLWLLLVTAGALVAYSAARGAHAPARRHALAAAAAALLVAAFFTKQTASLFMVGVGAALLLLAWRMALTYGATLALLGLPSLWLLDRATGHWFWRYVFELHQSHEFYWRRAFLETPWRIAGPPAHAGLLPIVGPALLLLPWALVRRRDAAVAYAAWLALVGALSACVGFGTQWAWHNALIPGVFFPALAAGVAAGRLVHSHQEEPPPPRHRPAAVYLVLAASLLLHPFDPRPFVPTAADRAAGERVIARLRSVPGDVLVPFHPFYGHLAGKRTFVHRMGLADIAAAGLEARGLADAIRSQRWDLAIFDDKIDGTWFMWPGFRDAYREVDRIAGPHTVSGAATVPTYVYAPR